MAKFDGSININTKIDSGGFNTGVASMVNALKPLAAAGVSLFAGVFGTKAIAAVSKLSAEFHRLGIAAQAVGQLYGIASEQTRGLVKELVGLGIQTDVANKSFINFAREGLDLSLLPALARGAQDLNVFADSGQTSSDVMDNLAHGILTLNPLILRNAGAAVDLDVAYRNFAESVGKSVAQLSTMEKRQAALIAVTEKLKGVSGLYELSQKSLAGQLASNKRIMNELKAALGTPFQDALFQIVRGFNTFIKILTAAIQPGGRFYGLIVNIGAALSVVGRFIASVFGGLAKLFGVDVPAAASTGSQSVGGLADSANEAAEAQSNLAGGIEKANKAAKGALAGFDQLDVLQQDVADTGGVGGGLGGGLEDMLGGLGDINMGDIFDPLDAIRAKADELQAKLKDLFAPLLPSLERLKTALQPLGEKVMEGLKWAYDNILVPVGKWAMETLLPKVLELLAVGAETLNKALDALRPLGTWLWENFLKPLGQFTGEVIIGALDLLIKYFEELGREIEKHPDRFRAAVVILGILALVILALSSPITIIIIAIAALVAAVIWLAANWDMVKEKVIEVWNSIKNTISDAVAKNSTTITNFLNTIWKSINDRLTAIKNKWSDIWNGIKDTTKSVINAIIGFVNGMVSAIANGINAVVAGVNGLRFTIPAWIPGLGGSSFGLNIPSMSAPQIPYLATGAVIPPNAQFLAMLGDQKSGRNIEAPEGLIRQIIQEELGSIRADIKVEFTGTLAALARELKPKIDAENVRIGKSLLAGGAA